jgi:Phosphoesterase family
MAPGLDKLQHIVVLMMENRSFDHMLGGLKAKDPRINGLTDNETNPDTTGAPVQVQPLAEYQSQLGPDPDHHFPAVGLQIFGGDVSDGRVANMQGFVKSYFSSGRTYSTPTRSCITSRRKSCRCLRHWRPILRCSIHGISEKAGSNWTRTAASLFGSLDGYPGKPVPTHFHNKSAVSRKNKRDVECKIREMHLPMSQLGHYVDLPGKSDWESPWGGDLKSIARRESAGRQKQFLSVITKRHET